ncbi:MAG: DUF262 domain-containing protein [Chloroflexi bacterium]|nr:DUF262 domain-containing protein [Chloroflexota bacterium]
MITKSREDLEDAVSFDSLDSEETKFFEGRQLELVTSVVDYNLGTIADLVEKRTINLSPQYQRRLRWGPKKQSQLIESFLMNVPVPTVYLNEDQYGQFSVIDGKQRLHTIHRFLSNNLRLRDLKVFSDINGKKFEDLPHDLRAVITTRPTIRAVIVLRQSSSNIKFEVFWRLNTGGVNLNAQEIRNSAFAGPFNDLIMELAESELFHRLLLIKKRSTSAIFQEMRDAELALRFLTFRGQWQDFSGGIQGHLDAYIEENQKPTDRFLHDARSDFESTLHNVNELFGDSSFRRWQPDRSIWRDQTLAALIDSQMIGTHGLASVKWRTSRAKLLREWRSMFSDGEFRESIDAATNTPALMKRRIRSVKQLIKRHVVTAASWS